MHLPRPAEIPRLSFSIFFKPYVNQVTCPVALFQGASLKIKYIVFGLAVLKELEINKLLVVN